MTKHVLIYAFLMFVSYTCIGQNNTGLSGLEIEKLNERLKIKNYRSGAVDSETTSQGVIIQNSLPKGSPQTDSRGQTFGVGMFWSRVLNTTDHRLELEIMFPVDSLPILSSPDSYLKLFLLPDTMTLEKVPLFNYGVSDLRWLLDTGLNKPTMLQRTIGPGEECLFYIAAVRYQIDHQPAAPRPRLHQGGGVLRTAFLLKGQDLFYRVSIDHDSVEFPCGQLVLKDD